MSREVNSGNGPPPPNLHAMMGGYPDIPPIQMNGSMNGNLFGQTNNRKNDYVDSGVGEYGD